MKLPFIGAAAYQRTGFTSVRNVARCADLFSLSKGASAEVTVYGVPFVGLSAMLSGASLFFTFFAAGAAGV